MGPRAVFPLGILRFWGYSVVDMLDEISPTAISTQPRKINKNASVSNSSNICEFK